MTSVFSPLQPPAVLKLLAHDVRWQLVSALIRSDYRVQELVNLIQQPANLVSYHLKQLRQEQLVMERRSSADRRDIYYSVDLNALRTHYLTAGEALHPALTEGAPTANTQEHLSTQPPARVLFLCTHNSARSQMAEGLLRHMGGDLVEVYSAGSEPSEVHPDAVRVMAQVGVDISHHRSKHFSEFFGQSFDYIITVCDQIREVCPYFPDDPEHIHWSFADPAIIGDAQERYRVFEEVGQFLTIRINFLRLIIERKRKSQQ